MDERSAPGERSRMLRRMRCVVCGEAIENARYANAWERSRKIYPCCSDRCVTAFDPDEHWIPAVFPDPADDAEAGRMLGVFRARIKQGDSPMVVVREMLLAGIVPNRLRGLRTRRGRRRPREPRARIAGRAWAWFSVRSPARSSSPGVATSGIPRPSSARSRISIAGRRAHGSIELTPAMASVSSYEELDDIRGSIWRCVAAPCATPSITQERVAPPRAFARASWGRRRRDGGRELLPNRRSLLLPGAAEWPFAHLHVGRPRHEEARHARGIAAVAATTQGWQMNTPGPVARSASRRWTSQNEQRNPSYVSGGPRVPGQTEGRSRS